MKKHAKNSAELKIIEAEFVVRRCFPNVRLIILHVWHWGSTVKTIELQQDGIAVGEGKKKAKKGEEDVILTSETQLYNEKQRRHDVIL